jgi:hypothetical protein
MSDKIKRLAKNLSEIIPSTDEMQETYDLLTAFMKKQKEYFSNFSPDNIVKLLIYIWSYQQTSNFELGDKLLNEIAFAVVFETEGNTYRESCQSCDGYGELDCDNCDGSGYERCDTCEGDGNMICSECDGEGTVIGDYGEESCENCDGKGEVTCDECGGNGEINCSVCGGGGKEECTNCEGNGEVETDDWEFTKYFIMTWDKYIKNRCEITENNSDITMSEYDFDRLRDNYVKLFINEDHADFFDFVKENEVYCINYNDSPKMHLLLDMKLAPHNFNIGSFAK